MSLTPPRFTWNWPSWLSELLSGLLAVLLAWGIVWLPVRWWVIGLFATALSVCYEFVVDANKESKDHRPWKDLEQRQLGIVVGVLVTWWLLR